ncbi:hypothetical protein GIB67_039049 [Kingdonia uniflora]|uniref:Uncharacterized protein n=1 Tax=Kingdonia uniflora TaxID=39325 RepID=A0A7J7LKT8_9MAGN|nr:hypothetical protein GIB67_039049 [Kingdonia uniflora]
MELVDLFNLLLAMVEGHSLELSLKQLLGVLLLNEMMKAGATVKLETTSQFTRRKGRLAGPSVFVPPESPLSGKKRHVRENWHDDVSHHLKKRGSRGKKDASREERIETAASGEENLEIVTPGWKNLQSVPTGEENLNSASAGGENLEVLAIDGENFDSSAAGGDNLELEVIGGENLETVANSGESFDSAATGGDNFIFGAAGGEDSELAVTGVVPLTLV